MLHKQHPCAHHRQYIISQGRLVLVALLYNQSDCLGFPILHYSLFCVGMLLLGDTGKDFGLSFFMPPYFFIYLHLLPDPLSFPEMRGWVMSGICPNQPPKPICLKPIPQKSFRHMQLPCKYFISLYIKVQINHFHTKSLGNIM